MGELQVRGPTSALMYWNNREKSRETFVGEWTRSGDKYLEDEEGYYVYCGRRDDMLKVGGIYVSPFEVEGALCTHPDVLEAAVVGWPDEDKLIKPKAFVVLKSADKAGESLARALQDHCKEQARALQISALDRVSHRAAEDRDRQDPALQAAGRERSGVSHFDRRYAAPSHSARCGRSPPPDLPYGLTTRFGGEAMRKGFFGRTGLEISELAFGGGVTGGILINADEATRYKALQRAVAGGINWIDTAPIYGNGASEETIGRHLETLAAAAQRLDQGPARSRRHEGYRRRHRAQPGGEPQAPAAAEDRAVPAAQSHRRGSRRPADA